MPVLNPADVIKKVEDVEKLVEHVPRMADQLGDVVSAVGALGALSPVHSGDDLKHAIAALGDRVEAIATGVQSMSDTITAKVIGELATTANFQQMRKHFGLVGLDITHLLSGVAPEVLMSKAHDLHQPAAHADPTAFRTSYLGALTSISGSLATCAKNAGFALPVDLTAWTTVVTNLLTAIPDQYLGLIGGHLTSVDLTAPTAPLAKLAAMIPAPPTPPPAPPAGVHAVLRASDDDSSGTGGVVTAVVTSAIAILAMSLKSLIGIIRSFLALVMDLVPLEVEFDGGALTGLAGKVSGGVSALANVLAGIGINLAAKLGVGLKVLSLTTLVCGPIDFLLSVVEIFLDWVLAMNTQATLDLINLLPHPT